MNNRIRTRYPRVFTIIFLVMFAAGVVSCSSGGNKNEKATSIGTNVAIPSDYAWFKSSTYHYQMAYPPQFSCIDDRNQITNLMSLISGGAVNPSVDYEALFKMRDEGTIQYPFFVIYTVPMAMPRSMDEIKRQMKASAIEKSSVNNLAVDEVLKSQIYDMRVGTPVIDAKNKRIYIKSVSVIKNYGRVVTILTVFLGKQGMTSLGYYYLENESDAALKEYALMVRSFVFDQGYRY